MSKFNQNVEIYHGEITKIEIQKKRKDRINIYLDGTYAFSCHIDLVFEYKLDKGKQLRTEDSKLILQSDDEKMAYQFGLKIALMKTVSVYDCRQKLKTYEFLPKSIDLAIERLMENHFLDDVRFATYFYEMKQNIWGPYRIKQGLKCHGIENELINSVTASLANGDQEYEEALRYARKKLESVGVLDQKGYSKVYGFIGRKGYSVEVIRRVMMQIKKEQKENYSEYD